MQKLCSWIRHDKVIICGKARVSSVFWQRATTVIIGWFGGSTRKNHDKWHT
jgi:hypothetical protein